MVFSSVPFLYYFLPGCVLLYFLAPRRLKNAALLLCSLLFYAWGEPNYVLLLLLSIAQGYAAALLVDVGDDAAGVAVEAVQRRSC